MKRFQTWMLAASCLGLVLSSCQRLPFDPNGEGPRKKKDKDKREDQRGEIRIMNEYIELGVLKFGEFRSAGVAMEVIPAGATAMITDVHYEMDVPGFTLEHPALPFSFNPMSMNGAAAIVVGFQAGKEPGEFVNVLVINGKQRVKVHATVIGRPDGHEPRIQVEAGDIFFGDLPLGTSKTMSATISNKSESVVTVQMGELGGPDFMSFMAGTVFPVRIAPGEIYEFPVVFTPTEVNRKYTAMMKFHIEGVPAEYVDNVTVLTGACSGGR